MKRLVHTGVKAARGAAFPGRRQARKPAPRGHLTGIALALGLGLALGLLWVLGEGATPATAAPAAKPLQGPGDVYCVAPISQTYAGCTRVFTSVQYAVDDASGGEIIKVAEGTYTDIHQRSNVTQVVYIDIPITIRGGYTTTDNFADPPHPITQPTTLDAGGQGRVVYIPNVTTTLEGLRLTNGVISGSVADYGGGIRALSPHLVISGCHVFSNTAREGGGVWVQSPGAALTNNRIYSNTARVGGGVYLYNSASAALAGNEVHNNSTIQYGAGGVYINGSPNASLTDNEIYSNWSEMSGGGVYIYSTSDGVTLTDNRIYSNTAQNTGGGIHAGADNVVLVANQICANKTSASGGGVHLAYCENPTLTNNDIYSNTANGFGGGIDLNRADHATLTGNQVYSNTSGSNGGGIYLSQSPTATLTGNQVYANEAGQDGGGVFLSQSPTATLTGNRVHANSAITYGAGIDVDHNDNTTLVNNVVTENRILGGGKGPGLYIIQSSKVHLLHTTVARNTGGDGVGVGLYYGGIGIPTLATLTNTILVSHTVGITVEQWSTATLAGTVWGDGAWANELPAVVNGTIISSSNVTGDPAFVDPDGGDYHITAASAGRDVAVSTAVTDDIDGDSRPFGVGKDIGADECGCHVRLNGTYYRSVQAGVDASSSPGDVVQVAGTCRGVETHGSYDQVVYISKTLTVRGGYSGDFLAWDPLTYPTTLDAEEQGHVVVIESTMLGSITPTLEALRVINGKDSQGGAGIYSRFADTIISGCLIYSNTATQNLGGGVYIAYGPNARLTGNRIYNNAANWPASSKGGGVYLGSCGSAVLTDNAVTNNTAPEGGGAYLFYSHATMANNIVADNEATVRGSGLQILNSSPHLLHTTFARNTGGDGSGIYVTRSGGSNYSIAAFTNTILVSHTVGITVGAGCTATLEGTLWGAGEWANGLPWGGGGYIAASTDVTGDPSFVDPDGGDYHITAASAAIDEGVATSVSTDMDGDARTISSAPDLGADESTFVLKVVKSGPAWVSEGAPIAYTLRVTNTGLITAESVILTDALPAGSNFVSASDGGSEAGGVVSWLPFDLLPGGGAVVRTFTVTATNAITNDDYVATPGGIPGIAGRVVVNTFVNHAPVADAGASQAVTSGIVTLDGSGSSDPDGQALAYLWQQTGGPLAVALTGADTVAATFSAPPFGGVYTFTLTVTDTYGASDADDTIVTVNLPALSISKSGPAEADPGALITYTLTVANSSSTAASFLVITDALPAGASFVGASDGGVRVGGIVSWTMSSLSGMGQIERTFSVTATETITNADYRVSCAEGVSAVGSVAVVTEIGERKVFLPLVLRNQ